MENLSVEEYINNKSLLELTYVVHDQKVEIVDTIMEEIIKESDGFYTLDSTLLERVKTQIFIESCTNLDLSILGEQNMGGYDLLCYYDELDDLIELLSTEYKRFDAILALKLKDYYSDKASTRAFAFSLKNILMKKIRRTKEDVLNYIANIDTKETADKIISFVDKVNKERGK